MSSADLKQQASAAIAQQQQLAIKIGVAQNEVNGLDPEDTMKIATMQNKIEGMKSNHAGLRSEATTLQNEAAAETAKETKEKFDELNAEHELAQKKEDEEQTKIEKQLAEKADEKSKSKESKFSIDGKKDFGDDLLFLSESRDVGRKGTEDIVAFTTTSPIKTEGQAIDSNAKSTKEDESVKAAGAGATGS